MRRRFSIDEKGQLVDREGLVLGRVVGITIEAVPESVLWGDIGGSTELGEDGTDETGGSGGVLDLDSFGGHGNSQPDRDTLTRAVNAVWGHYVSMHKPRAAAPDGQQRAIIREALKVATVGECKAAINGCAASAFHMGANERRKKYNRISNILKGKRGGKTTREQIDMFIEIAEKSGSQSHFSSGGDAKVQRAKRDVLDAYEFPGDERAQQRGKEAKAWLEQNGWTVEYEDSGRPKFQQR